jgi:hypothetical protein
VVEPVSPVSLKVVAAEVPTCTKLQGEPEQRAIKYWLIAPSVSVAAVQERLICVLPTGVAVRFEVVVKVGAAVVVEVVFEYGPVTFAVSMARTR